MLYAQKVFHLRTQNINFDGMNVVLFYTNRYQKQPLIVKGAGAGSEVTASGIFADIIRVSRN